MDTPFELAVDPDKTHHAHVSFDLGPLPVVFRDGALSGSNILTTKGACVHECCPVILVSLFDGGACVQSGFRDHTAIPHGRRAYILFEEGDHVRTIAQALEHPGVLERIERLQRLGDPVAFMERQVTEYEAFVDSMPETFGSDQAYHDWCADHGLEPRGLHTIGARERCSIRRVQDSRRMASFEGARRRSQEAHDLELKAISQMRTNALSSHGTRYRLDSDERRVTLHGPGESPWVRGQEVYFAEGMYRVVYCRPITITTEDIRVFGDAFIGHEGEPGWVVEVSRLDAS